MKNGAKISFFHNRNFGLFIKQLLVFVQNTDQNNTLAHKWMKNGSKGRERTCHKWMEKRAKLHSFVSVILGCSLAIIEETQKKKKLKNTRTQMEMDEEGIQGEGEIENLPQLDEKWHKGNFAKHFEMDEEGIKGPRDKKQMDEKWSKTSFLHKGNCGLFISKYSF